MKEIRTNGFTAKDLFNASSATPLKDIIDNPINVTDVCVVTRNDGQTAAYLKSDDGIIYATISESVMSQVEALSEMLPAEVKAVSKKSNAGRDYIMLELV